MKSGESLCFSAFPFSQVLRGIALTGLLLIANGSGMKEKGSLMTTSEP